MVWLSKILGMTYNLERREYRFKIKSRWDQDACYKQSWFWLPCCHLIPQRSATVRQSFSSIRTVPNNQWHQVTIIVSQKKKVTLIIILLDQKVQLISHFIELHTLMIYLLFGGTIHDLVRLVVILFAVNVLITTMISKFQTYYMITNSVRSSFEKLKMRKGSLTITTISWECTTMPWNCGTD